MRHSSQTWGWGGLRRTFGDTEGPPDGDGNDEDHEPQTDAEKAAIELLRALPAAIARPRTLAVP